MDFELSEQQKEATKAITDWWNDDGADQVFYLAGYAGTGKTTLIEYILPQLGLDINDRNDVAFGSYTGKAALVMRKKGMPTANTIHSMIYLPFEEKDGSITFKKSRDSIVSETSLVTLDECSMIGDEMANDVVSYGTKILVIGDPGQLPSFNGEGYFTKKAPNYFLTEIHRQAEGNPIIALSKLARNGQPLKFGDYGDGVQIVNADDMQFKDMMDADQVLTGKNETRRFLNQSMKEELGYNDVLPMDRGIKLVCLKNQRKLGLLNGMIFETSKGSNIHIGSNGKFFTQTVYDEEYGARKNIEICTGAFNDYAKPRSADEVAKARMKNRNYCEFDYAYALTVHKAMGSQWENVVVYDDFFGSWDSVLRARWLYTAITRAESGLTIMR